MFFVKVLKFATKLFDNSSNLPRLSVVRFGDCILRFFRSVTFDYAKIISWSPSNKNFKRICPTSFVLGQLGQTMTKMSKNYSDKELKDQGNKLFATRNYDGAIDCYTKAIMKNPSVPHYYTNRALCYLNQKRWPQAITDAKMALERDQNLVKGHFYLGKNNVLTEF